MPTQPIDINKLHSAIRKMSNDQVFYMLEEAIELLPQVKLTKLVKQFLDTGTTASGYQSQGKLVKGCKGL